MTKAEVFMRKILSCEEWKQKINDRLVEYNQNTKVVSYERDKIILSTGTILEGNQARIFKRRVLNNYHIWVKNIDSLLSGDITEKEIKSKQYSIGGISCQKKYGEKLRQNLNTGTPWNKGTKGNYPYSTTHNEEAKRKISEANRGEGNGMFGKNYTKEEKQHRSKIMKEKILSGAFTPNSNNRNTHWEANYCGKLYRSSWEAWYQYLNPVAEYEKLRIVYESAGEEKIYIVDFVDHTTKVVVEVKPLELTNTKMFKLKWIALCHWAELNDYKPLLVTKEWLKTNTTEIDYNMFDEKTALKIRRIHETN